MDVMSIMNMNEWDLLLPAAMRCNPDSLLDGLEELDTVASFLNEDHLATYQMAEFGRDCTRQDLMSVAEVTVPPPYVPGARPSRETHLAISPALLHPSARTLAVPPAPSNALLCHAQVVGSLGPGNADPYQALLPQQQQRDHCYGYSVSQSFLSRSSGTTFQYDHGPDSSMSQNDMITWGSPLGTVTLPECTLEVEKMAQLGFNGKEMGSMWPTSSGDLSSSTAASDCCTHVSTCTVTTSGPCAGPSSRSGSLSPSPSALEVYSSRASTVDRVCSVSGPLSALAVGWEVAGGEQCTLGSCRPLTQGPVSSQKPPTSKPARVPAGSQLSASFKNRKRSRQDVAATVAVSAATGVPKKPSKRMSCWNCGAHSTPQWRCGPDGPRTLCNACGVRYKKGLPLAYKDAEAKLQLQASEPGPDSCAMPDSTVADI